MLLSPWKSSARALCTLLLACFPILAGAQGGGVPGAGADALDDAPAIQERIREERRQGNAEVAWDLEQGLLELVVASPDDVRSAWILRDVGDHRVDTLARYDAGEYPPEIVLGCYYNTTSQFTGVAQRGSQSLSAGPALGNAGRSTCVTGSRRTARRALAEEALVFYVEAARILVRSATVADDAVVDVFMKLLATTYRTLNYGMGRQSLESLLSLQESKSASALDRAETLAVMGDWDLLFAEHFGNRYVDSAADAYARALALLGEQDDAETAVSTVFPSQTPVLLPTFAADGLTTQQTADAAGYVEVSFEIEDSGRTARVRTLDSSANASRSATRDLVNTVKQSRFRPMAENGQLLESAPVTVRYYIDD